MSLTGSKVTRIDDFRTRYESNGISLTIEESDTPPDVDIGWCMWVMEDKHTRVFYSSSSPDKIELASPTTSQFKTDWIDLPSNWIIM